jgi:hypothetical protein
MSDLKQQLRAAGPAESEGNVIEAATRAVLAVAMAGTLRVMMYLPVVLIALVLLCGLTDVLLGAFAGWHAPSPYPPAVNLDPPSQP